MMGMPAQPENIHALLFGLVMDFTVYGLAAMPPTTHHAVQNLVTCC